MSKIPNENRLILDRRIRNQRAQLRWWEELFNQHVHAHWRKAHLFYFAAVRRDRDAIARRARKEALEEATKIADEYECHLMGYGGSVDAKNFYEGGMLDAGQGIAAAIRALSESSPNPLQEQRENIDREGK